jgi:nitrite reductase/ring-hydroxylating ferredoxin subunit
MQQYADIYLLQNHCTHFGCPSHPFSGGHKTVTAASGTGLITYPGNNLLQRGL